MSMVLVARRLTADEARLDPGQLADLALEEDDEDSPGEDSMVDLDKTWHAVHFLLTGTAWELEGDAGLAVLGGREVGDDLGYGPARVLAPPDVDATSRALSAVDEQALRARFDPERMAALEIYPTGIWDEDDILDDYVLPAFRDLAGLDARAAAEGQAMLLLLT